MNWAAEEMNADRAATTPLQVCDQPAYVRAVTPINLDTAV